MKEYSTCHMCGKRVAMRVNGTFWHHTNGIREGGGALPFSEHCSGSGEPVADHFVREGSGDA